MKKLLAVAAVAAVGCLVAGRAHAATKIQGNLVDLRTTAGTYDESPGQEGKGKYMIMETKAPGSCGTLMKLLLAKINCPSHPDAGKCSGSGDPCTTTKECPSGQLCLGNEGGSDGQCNATNHVFEVNWEFTGGLEGQAGLKFNLVKGKAVFLASGKNGVTGGQAFGPIGCSILGTPLGFGKTVVHETGTDPNECDSVPLFPGNNCTDGDPYLWSGIIVGVDPSPGSCSNDNQCSLTQVCSGGACVTQTCSQDSDCRGHGQGVECDENSGQCCFLIQGGTCDVGP